MWHLLRSHVTLRGGMRERRRPSVVSFVMSRLLSASALVLLVLVGESHAQTTGGSFGGNSVGGASFSGSVGGSGSSVDSSSTISSESSVEIDLESHDAGLGSTTSLWIGLGFLGGVALLGLVMVSDPASHLDGWRRRRRRRAIERALAQSLEARLGRVVWLHDLLDLPDGTPTGAGLGRLGRRVGDGLVLVDGGSRGDFVRVQHVAPPKEGALDPYQPNVLGRDVFRLSIVLDASARRALQDELATLSKDPDAFAALRTVVARLRELEPSWTHAGRFVRGPLHAYASEKAFHAVVAELRGRYRHEHDDARAPALRARPEEGEGLVVVSLVIEAQLARDTRHRPRPAALDRASTARALEELAASPAMRGATLGGVRFEVVWSPAADADRLSSLELATLYPELAPLDPEARLGRIECAACTCVYAAELGRCPGCGAVSSEA